jgi:hypothetical protein
MSKRWGRELGSLIWRSKAPTSNDARPYTYASPTGIPVSYQAFMWTLYPGDKTKSRYHPESQFAPLVNDNQVVSFETTTTGFLSTFDPSTQWTVNDTSYKLRIPLCKVLGLESSASTESPSSIYDIADFYQPPSEKQRHRGYKLHKLDARK